MGKVTGTMTVASAIMTLICPPIGIAMGLSTLVGWAVFSDDDTKKHSIKTQSRDLTCVREEIGCLTADLPDKAKERFVSEIITCLKEEVCHMAGKTDDCQVAVKREGNVIKAFLSEDGETGHIIEFALP